MKKAAAVFGLVPDPAVFAGMEPESHCAFLGRKEDQE